MNIIDAAGNKYKLLADGSKKKWTWFDTFKDHLLKWYYSRSWRARQKEFEKTGTRYYGNGGTIHGSTTVDVEVDKNGKVVSVWFRCQALPFKQSNIDDQRAADMIRMYETNKQIELCGVEVKD